MTVYQIVERVKTDDPELGSYERKSMLSTLYVSFEVAMKHKPQDRKMSKSTTTYSIVAQNVVME
jgi:hypothetical protein